MKNKLAGDTSKENVRRCRVDGVTHVAGLLQVMHCGGDGGALDR